MPLATRTLSTLPRFKLVVILTYFRLGHRARPHGDHPPPCRVVGVHHPPGAQPQPVTNNVHSHTGYSPSPQGRAHKPDMSTDQKTQLPYPGPDEPSAQHSAHRSASPPHSPAARRSSDGTQLKKRTSTRSDWP